MKNTLQLVGVSIVAAFTLLLAGCASTVVTESITTQSIAFTAQNGGSGTGCPGAYKGFAKMTNSAGTFWITPPANTTSGTLTDASGFSSPYVSVAYVVRKSDFNPWCGTNSVTFPATSSTQYSLTVYVKSTTPPPTNGQPMTLQINWQ